MWVKMKLSKIANDGESVMETRRKQAVILARVKRFFFDFLVNLNFLESIFWVSHFQHAKGYN